MKNLIESDYRDYLKRRYLELKKKNSKFSLPFFSKRLDLSTPFLHQVLNKKRNIDPSRISEILFCFAIPESDHKYFLTLYLASTATDADIRKYFMDILSAMNAERLLTAGRRKPVMTASEVDLAGNSLKATIIGMTAFANFKPEAKWVRSRLTDPSFTLPQIEEALEEMIRDQQIFRNAAGAWQTGESFLKTAGMDMPNLRDEFTLQASHRPAQFFKQKNYSEKKPNYIFSYYMGFSKSHLIELNKIFRNLEESLEQLEKKVKKAEWVINVTNSYFPVAQLIKEKKTSALRKRRKGYA